MMTVTAIEHCFAYGQVAHDNREWEHQGVLSNADLTCTEHGEMVIDWEKLDYAAARTARQIANIAYALVVRTILTLLLSPCVPFICYCCPAARVLRMPMAHYSRWFLQA